MCSISAETSALLQNVKTFGVKKGGHRRQTLRLQLRPLLLLLSRRVNATRAIQKPLLILNGVKVLRGGNGDAMQALLFLSFSARSLSCFFLIKSERL